MHVPTFRALLLSSLGSALLQQGWTRTEVTAAQGRLLTLAAGWAAKEATMKALGEGIGAIDPADIEIVRNVSRPPHVQLRRSAQQSADRCRCTHVSLSISHDGDYVTAFAVALLSKEIA